MRTLVLALAVLFSLVAAVISTGGACATRADQQLHELRGNPGQAGATRLLRLRAQEQLYPGAVARRPGHRSAEIGPAHRASGELKPTRLQAVRD